MHLLKNKKSGNKFASALFLFCLFALPSYAQQDMKDVSVSITLSEYVHSSNYTKFIRITNNDDVSGLDDNLSVFAEMNLTGGEENNSFEWNATKKINSYSESGFGTLRIENSSYYFCVKVYALNFFDYNESNNQVCAGISTSLPEQNSSLNISENLSSAIEEENTSLPNETDNSIDIPEDNLSDAEKINSSPYVNDSYTGLEYNFTEENETNPCGCTLQIITDREIFSDGEKLEFRIIDCGNGTKYDSAIEYWVEDTNGIVKNLLNTTNKSRKSYTPSINYDEKYFLIKARIQGCTNITQKLVVFTGKIGREESEDIQETFIDIYGVSEDEENMKVYAGIKGYKGDSQKTLVSVWIENDGEKLSEVTKFYVNGRNSFFDLKIPVFLNEKTSGIFFLVAEGLGKKEETKITLSFSEKESEEEKKQLMESEYSSAGGITSFYSRKKNFEENITLYISVDNPRGKTLTLEGEKENLVLENISERNTVNFSIYFPNETVHAKLYYGSELLDSAELFLNLTQENEKMQGIKESVSAPALGIMQKENYSLQENISAISPEMNNKITGRIISVRPSGKSISFAAGAAVLCFIVFNRKARTFLLQKTRSLWLHAFSEEKTKLFK